jgi:hypothetical protein
MTNITTIKDKADIVKEYLNRGWFIARWGEEKNTPPAYTNGFNSDTNDPEQIDLWLEVYPEANFIVNCENSNLAIIDIDIKDGSSFREENNHYIVISGDGIEYKVPKTYLVQTGSGGFHLYYKGLVNRKVRLLKGIDVISKGSGVFVPPSKFKGGNPYEVINDLPLAEFPENFKKLAEDDTKAKTRSISSNGNNGKSIWTEEVKEGSRNDSLFRYGSRLKGKGLSDEEITALTETYNASFCKPPLDSKELNKIIESVLKQAENEPDYSEYDPNFDFSDLPEMPESFLESPFTYGENIIINASSGSIVNVNGEYKSNEPWKLWGFQELMKPIPPRPHLIQDLIVDNSLVLFYGEPGTGKTYVALHMAMCIANGLPWLGKKTMKKKVLFIDEDNGQYRVKSRIQEIANGMGKTEKDLVPIEALIINGIKLDREADMKRIMDVVTNNGFELIVIDVFRNFFEGKENDSDVLSKIMLNLRTIVEKTGISLIILHHTTKNGETYRGSSAIGGAVDLEIWLKKEKSKDHNPFGELITTKSRDTKGWSRKIVADLSIGDNDETKYSVVEFDHRKHSNLLPSIKVGTTEQFIYDWFKYHDTISRKQIQDLVKAGKLDASQGKSISNKMYSLKKEYVLLEDTLIMGEFTLDKSKVDPRLLN